MNGELIRRQRLINRMSLSDLANKMGVHRATILRWETGEIAQIQPQHVARLIRIFPVLGSSLDWYKDKQDIALLNAYSSAEPNVQQAIRLLLNLDEKNI